MDRRIVGGLAAVAPDGCRCLLQLENKVETMLPCNVIVQDVGYGQTEIVAIDPIASMQAVDNLGLKRAAERVSAKLRRVAGNLL